MKKAGATDLVREDWDFSGCPEGREYYCRAYEFAREVPWIIDAYKKSQTSAATHSLRPGPWGPEGFDEAGNFYLTHYLRVADGQIENVVRLELPPGFPEKPYCLIEHRPLPEPVVPEFETVRRSVVNDFATRCLADQTLVPLEIEWDYPDKRLVHDFAAWLKRARPYSPRERRGRGSAREVWADLKALGALRLMKVFTASEADTYTLKAGRVFYEKAADWYEAKRRAVGILKREFGCSV